MSTPSHEHGSIKLIAFWTFESRILMHHPTFIGNRKQTLFPMNVKRRRNTSKPAWTNVITSLLYVGNTAKPCFPKRQTSCSQGCALQLYEANHTSMFCIGGSRIPTSRMSQHPHVEDGFGLSMFYYQADNKHSSKLKNGLTQKIAKRTPGIK